MANSIGRHVVREIRAELGLRGVDDRDHATKRGGGVTTGPSAGFKVPEKAAHDKTAAATSEMSAVVKAATGGGAPAAGPSPSDVS